MSSLSHAHEAYKALQSRLSPATRAHVQQRLLRWEQRLHRQRSPLTTPALVMRPGLPPRPLNPHYFTVIQSYD